MILSYWSGREDSNLRPLGPKSQVRQIGKFCLCKSCSHHEFIRGLWFLTIRCQILAVFCRGFRPHIGHTFGTRAGLMSMSLTSCSMYSDMRPTSTTSPTWNRCGPISLVIVFPHRDDWRDLIQRVEHLLVSDIRACRIRPTPASASRVCGRTSP